MTTTTDLWYAHVDGEWYAIDDYGLIYVDSGDVYYVDGKGPDDLYLVGWHCPECGAVNDTGVDDCNNCEDGERPND